MSEEGLCAAQLKGSFGGRWVCDTAVRAGVQETPLPAFFLAAKRERALEIHGARRRVLDEEGQAGTRVPGGRWARFRGRNEEDGMKRMACRTVSAARRDV